MSRLNFMKGYGAVTPDSGIHVIVFTARII